MALTSLDQSVLLYYSAGLADSTRRLYQSGRKQFISFCKEYGIKEVLPVSEETICYFVAHLGDKGLSHSTIQSYMAAVRDLQIDYGFPSPLFAKMPRLERIIKGLRRIRGQQGKAPRQKRPITPAILRQMRAYWVGIGSDYKYTMLWATEVTCFFGFMRAGELVVPNAKDFDPKKHLTFDSVAADSRVEPTLIQSSLRTSKTDPYGRVWRANCVKIIHLTLYGSGLNYRCVHDIPT